MPVKPINDSAFTPSNLLKISTSRLEGSDKNWVAKPCKSESSARLALLLSELSRFFCSEPKTAAHLANNDHDQFFLFSVVPDEHRSTAQFTEEELVRAAFDASSNRLEDSAKKTMTKYNAFINMYPLIETSLHKTMLRVMLLPPASLFFFVKDSIAKDYQTPVTHKINKTQTKIKEMLRCHPRFQLFLESEAAMEESQLFLNTLLTFKLHDEIPLMSSLSLEATQEIHRAQWQEIHGPTQED